MTYKVFFLIVLSFLSVNSYADSQQLEDQATFLAQIALGDKTMTEGVFSETRPIHVTGRIHVAANDINQDGEILIVANYDGVMFMKTTQGWRSWNGQLDSLKAAEPSQTLKAIEDIEISNNLTLPGDFSIFIGYRIDNQIHHSKTALNFRIFKGLVDEETATSLQGNAIDSNNLPLLSDDRFLGQFYVDGQPLSINKLTISQEVDVYARIHVAEDNIGQTAEILRVISYQGKMYMKTPGGWILWNRQLSSLVASEAPRALQTIEDIEIERNFALAGNFEIFFGYRINNQLYYNGIPLTLTIREKNETATGTATGTGTGINDTLTITGTPKTNTHIYDAYQFIPTVRNADTDNLIFSIINQPSWAEFDPTTGLLHGLPESEGIYSDITISVSDDNSSTSLPAFSIEVLAPADLAHKFGKATQGNIFSSNFASYAIDNDVDTYNHTKCNATDNWWQLELPNPTLISNFMIQGRNAQVNRLEGANVYITQAPYNGSLDESDKVATLLGTASEQETTFISAKSANYLIVKAKDDNCLHIANVEVYGQTPSAPVFSEHDTAFLIQGNSAIGKRVVTLSAFDYQHDDLTYSINGNVPFSIDSLGNLTVAGSLTAGTYNFDVVISDGNNIATTHISIQATSLSAVEEALASGRVNDVTEGELIQATLDEIDILLQSNTLLAAFYNNEAIDYAPSKYSQLINTAGDAHQIFPILLGNQGKTLAAAGTKNNTRFAAFGSVPMEHFEEGNNLSYEPQFKRLLAWLLTGEPINMAVSETNKTIALSYTGGEKNEIKNWLAANYANWTIKDCNDASVLANCYNDVDLVITGWQADESVAQTIRQALENVVNQGKPVLYLHTRDSGTNDVAHAIADLFDFILPHGGNFWSADSANWNSVTTMQMQASIFAKIKTLFTHFKNVDFNFDWSQCENSHGEKGSNYDKCKGVPGLASEFEEGAAAVKLMINTLDTQKKNIFKSDTHRLQKLLVLSADKFRQTVTYPMDKVKTDDNAFMKSYYADHAVYNYRTINPAQADMGNFSRSDFSHITPITKTVNLISKVKFRSTGAYALPGQTVKVTRNDSSDLAVKVFINTLRSGATHQYEAQTKAHLGYNRPKYLQTPHMEIKSGETIEFTSPYGGTLQLEFSANDLPIEIKFENVGEHAYWAGPEDDVSFTEKLDAGDFDWAEVVTSGFEVHSTLEKMRKSVADPKWGTAAVLANATKRYMSNFPHILAGFQGPGIDVVDEVHDFATSHDLTIETLDKVKHMNADQANCGYGCSGNPYDAYWAYSPIGHGDVHELGHGLEKSRFRFEGWEGHSTTNPYSYYTKSKYNEDTGGEPDCQNLPFQDVFNKLQASVAEADATAYLQANLWASSSWSHQFMVTLQAMMHAQKMGRLDNGWHLLARLHILEREIKRAKKDWDAKKADLGFSSYTVTEFDAMRKNDWMLISLSHAAGLDFRNYLTMIGIEYSIKAADQVASFSYPDVPREFFVSTSNGYCKTDVYGSFLDKDTLDIDGLSIWPE